jgi:DedD protein
VWTAPVTLPDVARPGTTLTELGPLVITQPERMPSAAPPNVETQSAPSPIVSPALPTAPAPEATPAVEGSWAIQAGAFANPAGAALLVQQLQQQGLPAFERDMAFGARGVFRVAFAGPFSERQAAEAALARLRATSGFERVVLRDLSTR